ncbi:MAG: hypothetical protein H7839_20850 [Magnetococcus sp. YQC-5]
MLSISQPGLLMPYTMHWFSEHPPSPLQNWRPMVYWCCRDVGVVAGFKRQQVATRIVSLNQPWEEIESRFVKDTAYEMRRAARDGVQPLFDQDLALFLDFYRTFAKQKGLGVPRLEELKGYLGHVTIGKALLGNEPLVMNFYIMDSTSQRVRMLYSASHFRTMSDPANRYLVGRANRFLHREAMRFFKNQGFSYYDLGGFAPESQDPAVMAINRFKESIGGSLLWEVHYTSLMVRLTQSVRAWMKDLGGR